jgi:hypothetical protein
MIMAGYRPAMAQAGTLYLPMVTVDGVTTPPPVDTVVRAPANFAELIVHNTEAGIWTEEEGILRTLEFFAGKRTLADLPGGRKSARWRRHWRGVDGGPLFAQWDGCNGEGRDQPVAQTHSAAEGESRSLFSAYTDGQRPCCRV